MRYRPQHKDKTRQRIIDRAATLFRRHGYDGVGIDTLMAAAGLTRGGFYGYFKSKAALFAAVIRKEHDFTRRMRERTGTTKAALAHQASEVVAGYLHPDNIEKVAPNCVMASLSVDVARAGAEASAAYGENVRDLAAQFARALPGAENDDRRALAAIATCVGGLIVARAVGDADLGNRILQASRRSAERELSRRRP
jgi:TetR/AcrR family transcriptional repressor of nem operon